MAVSAARVAGGAVSIGFAGFDGVTGGGSRRVTGGAVTDFDADGAATPDGFGPPSRDGGETGSGGGAGGAVTTGFETGRGGGAVTVGLEIGGVMLVAGGGAGGVVADGGGIGFGLGNIAAGLPLSKPGGGGTAVNAGVETGGPPTPDGFEGGVVALEGGVTGSVELVGGFVASATGRGGCGRGMSASRLTGRWVHPYQASHASATTPAIWTTPFPGRRRRAGV